MLRIYDYQLQYVFEYYANQFHDVNVFLSEVFEAERKIGRWIITINSICLESNLCFLPSFISVCMRLDASLSLYNQSIIILSEAPNTSHKIYPYY